MAEYLVFERMTGVILRGGLAPSEQIGGQATEPGEVALEVPAGVMGWPTINLDLLKAYLCQRIDEQCGAIRQRFITTIPGQEATYQLKLAEAQRWQASGGTGSYPYLSREATKRSMSMAALVTEVVGLGALWIGTVDPELESTRVATKKTILAAPDAPAALLASMVDWEALLP